MIEDELDIEQEALALAERNDPFLHGHCAALAVALKQLIGGRIGVILVDDEQLCLVHAYVECANGQAVDLKGVRTAEEIWDEFKDMELDPYVGAMTEEEVLELNYGSDGPDAETRAKAEELAAQVASLVRRKQKAAAMRDAVKARGRGQGR